MEILVRPMGDYQTNCYILKKEGRSLVIDPGMGAVPWVTREATGPVAILNTHGHFDHVWSNAALQEALKVPLYTPEEDLYLLTADPYGLGQPPSKADICVKGSQSFEQGGFAFHYHHVPGHTPGCSVIEFDEGIFSGDFIFKGSIGRCDFPKSDPEAMRRSILWFMETMTENDKPVYPGHGPATTVGEAKAMLPAWLRYLS